MCRSITPQEPLPVIPTLKEITKNELIQYSLEKPSNYHCSCKYCQTKFMGNLMHVESNSYYSNTLRKKYLPSGKKQWGKLHNNPGHFVGYRWAIQNLTKEKDIVFDPTVGSGTAIFEAENNKRSGVGIELEFAESTRYLCENRGLIKEGNALDINPEEFLKKESIQLLINGTPYPIIHQNVSSDIHTSENKTEYGNYKNNNNIGKWKLKEFRSRIHELYTKFIPYLKSKGFLCIIIKDPFSNKKPFNLHEIIIDSILENNPNLKPYGHFIHLHVPQTLFIRAYKRRFGIWPTLHQTGIILKKD